MSFNFAESLVSAEIPGLQSAAVGQVGLGDETGSAGAQSEAAGLPVVPPGLDPASLHGATQIKAFTTGVASQLAAGAGLQNVYGESFSSAGMTYTLADELGAAGVSTVNAAAPSGLV